MVPNSLQASVCDEQLTSIGGGNALSGNKKIKRKNEVRIKIFNQHSK